MKEAPDVAQLIRDTLAVDPFQTAATRLLPVRPERRFT